MCDGSTGDGPEGRRCLRRRRRGDLSFNDSAVAGLKQAVEELDATCQEVEAGAGETDADREERLRLLADAGFNPIIAVGFVYSPGRHGRRGVPRRELRGRRRLRHVHHRRHGRVNVADLNFAEEQGSFLVGVAAALTTKTKKSASSVAPTAR